MKQLKIELLEILETFLIMKKKIITNQQEQITFGVAIIFTLKVTVIDIKNYHLKDILIKLDHT